jgi:micrococcal nuclease
MILTALALTLCPPGPATAHPCVTDGDTFRWGTERIRLVDIDAPELAGRCPEERALALRSRDRLLELLNSGEVTIERRGQDRYGRTLSRVRVNGIDIGQQLVAEGLARAYEGRRRSWC